MAKLRVFFATDVHGSDVTFRKFLNAGKFYKANAIIMGGDLTGKILIPIVEQPDGSKKASYQGKEIVLKSETEVTEFEKNAKSMGAYPYQMSRSELDELRNNPQKLDETFMKAMLTSIRDWVCLAEERLRGTGITCYMQGGNDDPYEIDEILDKSHGVVRTDRRTTDLGGFELVGLDVANMTPWKAPRDVEEGAITKMVDDLMSKVKNPGTSILNFHCPPHNSSIDFAPKLDGELRPVMAGGRPTMVPVGSTAIRGAIEKYQPLLGIHGHIHESRGNYTIGKTKGLNPGSEYLQGQLKGAIIELEDGKLRGTMFIQG